MKFFGPDLAENIVGIICLVVLTLEVVGVLCLMWVSILW